MVDTPEPPGAGLPSIDDAHLRSAMLVEVALAAGRGDPESLTALIRDTSRAVWRACAALVDGDTADDLTQETYLRAIRSIGSYRGESDPRGWLLTIARRVCAEEVRRRQRARSAMAELAVSHDLVQDETASGSAALWQALARLPAAQREAIGLTAILGLSYAEAAQVCGCAIGTIRSRVFRARADLMASLGPDGHGSR